MNFTTGERGDTPARTFFNSSGGCMTDTLTPPKLRMLPVQFVEMKDGILLKRGRVEFKVKGERAADVVGAALTAASNGGATPDQICQSSRRCLITSGQADFLRSPRLALSPRRISG